MIYVDLRRQPRDRIQYALLSFTESPLDSSFCRRFRCKTYWIDKYEVTNRQFKQFLDQGGYRKQQYWKQPFLKDGHPLAWAEAYGPIPRCNGSVWPRHLGSGPTIPRGQDDYPVTGVSWFEAAAYAEFAGKSLPTIYHWTFAASPWHGPDMIPLSNFSGQGPARVGATRGISRTGTYDMAGNVKEWCLNEAGPGKRYIMGGAWDDPTYMFNDPDARSPFERSANFGFRCARYAPQAAAKASEPVIAHARNFSQEKPVSDEVFNAFKRLYSYDKTPLHAVIESTEQTEDWTQQKITFDAAYGNERMIAYLFLPKTGKPPYQTVLYFPGADAIDTRSSSSADALQSGEYDFIVKGGRAVMVPLYKGTYERGDGYQMAQPHATNLYRDHVVDWSKDLGRSIDYLETRPDIDRSKLAFEGASWGAAMGALLPAVEDRIKVCVLHNPGFYPDKTSPEVDQLNFAPRVKVPVLMLDGRFDYYFPSTSSQEPMFRLLGTPNKQKLRVLFDSGHDLPRTGIIKETLNWLDRYLGPVN